MVERNTQPLHAESRHLKADSQSVKRGGTAEVDACRFRPQKGINLYGAKGWAFFYACESSSRESAVGIWKSLLQEIGVL